jgi:hypothetical protein
MNDPAVVEKAKEDFRVFLWIVFKHYLWDVQKDPTNVQYDIASFLSMHPATHKVFGDSGKSQRFQSLWSRPVKSGRTNHLHSCCVFSQRLHSYLTLTPLTIGQRAQERPSCPSMS